MHFSKKIYGSVSINLPAPYPTVISGFVLLLILFLIYSFNVDFTATYMVKGYLNAKSGIARVYAARPGIINRSFVKAGQQVAEGDPLFGIDTTIDNLAFKTEQDLLQDRLKRLNDHIQVKTKYIQSLQPLLLKHYVSAATYQSLRDQVIALETSRHEVNMAILQHRHLRSYIVRAPIAGSISSLQAHIGQKVTSTQSLLTVLPQQSDLVAELYVPVAKSGFLQPGVKIALRYDAYPYQHFGVASARIHTISKSALNDREDDKPLHIGEPYYKVIAYLERQTIPLYGEAHPLQQGMTCSAVISGAHKTLWRWMIDPLHHLE